MTGSEALEGALDRALEGFEPDPRSEDSAAAQKGAYLARRLQGTYPKWAARCGSVLTGWSRINDRKHYLSQVVLGWTIAWNAVDAIHRDEQPGATEDISKG